MLRAALFIVILLALCFNSKGQTLYCITKKKTAEKDTVLPTVSFALPFNFQSNLLIIDKANASKCLPFFCEGEHILDKKLPLPLRVRLGSQQQVDWLESKPSALRPQ